jgi:hypothetical protein
VGKEMKPPCHCACVSLSVIKADVRAGSNL